MAGSTIVEDRMVSVEKGSSSVSQVDLEKLSRKNFNGKVAFHLYLFALFMCTHQGRTIKNIVSIGARSLPSYSNVSKVRTAQALALSESVHIYNYLLS